MMKKLFVLGLLIALFQTLAAQTSPHGAIKIECGNCHSTDSWKMQSDAQFSHATTGFDLTGAHRKLDCRSCHEKLKFTGINADCQPCHTDIHKGELGPNCLRCHSTQNWKITDIIQRHQQTRFPLLGQHITAPCEACHTQNANQQYTGLPTTCIGCHRYDYLNSQNPNHTLAGFSTECTICHPVNAAAWGSGFDHQMTAFPLSGAHRAVQCSLCHTNNVFKSTPHDCYACHLSNYNAVQSPSHVAGNFSHQCLNCHNTTIWTPSTFNHATTLFPLVGAHQTVPCASCHVNNVYAGLHQNCIDCHRTDFNSAVNPNHIAGNFSAICTTCHSMNTWSPATFDHSTTKFNLSGAHIATPCASCHVTSNYQLSYTNCYMCHQADFQKPTNPNHVAGNFAHTCDQCHSTSVWTPSTFNHANTPFPLVGAHQAVPCASCHVNNVFAGLHQNCIDCHQLDFNGANNPNHVAGNFSTLCTMCHSLNGWSPATFDHSTTKFALTGAHTTVQCQTCHTNGNYRLVYSNCYQCHSTDFSGATTPVPHIGFSTDCSSCHTTNPGWSPSTYSHANAVPRFPQDNRHQSAACTKCHQNPTNYTIACCQSSGCHNSCAGGGD
jgi:hypothetical protein